MKLERLGSEPLALGRGSPASVAIAELRVLSDVDDVLPPEALDASIAALDLSHGTGISELRLSAPPVRSPSGDALFRSLTRFLDKVVARDGGDSIEERKMGALLKGIHGLELEIRAQMSRNARV